MSLWGLRNPCICYACLIHTATDKLYDVKRESLNQVFEFMYQEGAWQFYRYFHREKEFVLAFYRFRFLIFYMPEITSYIATDEFIREHFLIDSQDIPTIINKISSVIGGDVVSTYTYPVVIAQDFKLMKSRTRKSARPSDRRFSWVDDGITSFYYRIFDSTVGGVGYIRVSRWLTISYGLSDNVNRELINMVYEKILYSMRRRGKGEVIIGDDEFALLDGLSRYTVPTELNLFLQGMGIRIAIYLTFAGVTLSVVQSFLDRSLPLQIIIGVYVAVVGMLVIVWRVIHKIVRIV